MFVKARECDSRDNRLDVSFVLKVTLGTFISIQIPPQYDILQHDRYCVSSLLNMKPPRFDNKKRFKGIVLCVLAIKIF